MSAQTAQDATAAKPAVSAGVTTALFLTVLIFPLVVAYFIKVNGLVADAYGWYLLAHIGSLLGFMLSHGAPALVSLRLSSTTKETTKLYIDLGRDRIIMLAMGATLGLVLSTGISMGFFREYWGAGWIWATLGLAIFITFSMSFLGRRQFDTALKALEEGSPARPGMPGLAAAIGIAGVFLILWLVLFKPF